MLDRPIGRSAVPPGEELVEKLFHATAATGRVREGARNMASAMSEVLFPASRACRGESLDRTLRKDGHKVPLRWAICWLDAGAKVLFKVGTRA